MQLALLFLCCCFATATLATAISDSHLIQPANLSVNTPSRPISSARRCRATCVHLYRTLYTTYRVMGEADGCVTDLRHVRDQVKKKVALTWYTRFTPYFAHGDNGWLVEWNCEIGATKRVVQALRHAGLWLHGDTCYWEKRARFFKFGVIDLPHLTDPEWESKKQWPYYQMLKSPDP